MEWPIYARVTNKRLGINMVEQGTRLLPLLNVKSYPLRRMGLPTWSRVLFEAMFKGRRGSDMSCCCKYFHSYHAIFCVLVGNAQDKIPPTKDLQIIPIHKNALADQSKTPLATMWSSNNLWHNELRHGGEVQPGIASDDGVYVREGFPLFLVS